MRTQLWQKTCRLGNGTPTHGASPPKWPQVHPARARLSSRLCGEAGLPRSGRTRRGPSPPACCGLRGCWGSWLQQVLGQPPCCCCCCHKARALPPHVTPLQTSSPHVFPSEPCHVSLPLRAMEPHVFPHPEPYHLTYSPSEPYHLMYTPLRAMAPYVSPPQSLVTSHIAPSEPWHLTYPPSEPCHFTYLPPPEPCHLRHPPSEPCNLTYHP